MSNKVSVILPCFNECDNIIPLVEKLHEVLGNYEHEVVVVDDNSPDGTYEIIKSKNYSYVSAILRETDPSLGKSIRTGLENATGDIFIIMDSDFNHRPEYLPVFLANLAFFDCVCGSRFVYGGGMEGRFRLYASWLFNIAVRLLTRKMVTDSLYGFVAIKRSTLEKMDYERIFWGYGDYCIRLMYYLQENNNSILQLPIQNGRRLSGQSNGNLIKTFIQYTAATFKLLMDARKP